MRLIYTSFTYILEIASSHGKFIAPGLHPGKEADHCRFTAEAERARAAARQIGSGVAVNPLQKQPGTGGAIERRPDYAINPSTAPETAASGMRSISGPP